TTLSGGEAQRVKLARELARRSTGRTLYLLDEPTTGLHFDDIKKLLSVLRSLTEKGNTVIVIEHNLDVIKTADWIVDLGPEGGELGGEIVAEGTPEDVVRIPASYTGQFLRPALRRSAAPGAGRPGARDVPAAGAGPSRLVAAGTSRRVACRNDAERIAAARYAYVLIVAHAQITEALFAGAPGLVGLVRTGIGLDTVDLPAATRHGVCVAHVPDFCYDEVADT